MRFYRAIDSIAALDHEFVHFLQETLYFFTVLFLVDLQLGDSRCIKICFAVLVLAISFVRLAYFLSPYLLVHWIARLEYHAKGELLLLHQKKNRKAIARLLRNELGVKVASRVSNLLCKRSKEKVERLAKVS